MKTVKLKLPKNLIPKTPKKRKRPTPKQIQSETPVERKARMELHGETEEVWNEWGDPDLIPF